MCPISPGFVHPYAGDMSQVEVERFLDITHPSSIARREMQSSSNFYLQRHEQEVLCYTQSLLNVVEELFRTEEPTEESTQQFFKLLFTLPKIRVNNSVYFSREDRSKMDPAKGEKTVAKKFSSELSVRLFGGQSDDYRIMPFLEKLFLRRVDTISDHLRIYCVIENALKIQESLFDTTYDGRNRIYEYFQKKGRIFKDANELSS